MISTDWRSLTRKLLIPDFLVCELQPILVPDSFNDGANHYRILLPATGCNESLCDFDERDAEGLQEISGAALRFFNLLTDFL